MGNVIPCGGSRQSSTASSGQTSHRASNLWAAANLSGPGQTPACNSSSTLPDYNGGHRQNSKPVADGGSGTPAGGLGQDPVGTLSMPTAASKMQGNSVTTSYGCRTSSYVGLRSSAASGSNLHPGPGSSNQEHHHQLRMRRPLKLKCQLGIAKNSHASTAIKWACDRLDVDVSNSMTLTTEAILNGWTVANREGHPPHILIIDCRAHKQLDVESIARSVRHGAHGDNVVLIGIVKKSMMEKEELTVGSFLQLGFNRLLLDSGSRGYWLNELAIIIHTDVEASLRLRCAGLLLTALDNCRDVVQVTDSHDRVIYENNSTEKVLGFQRESSDSEKALWDFQDTVNLTESVLPENDTMEVIRGADLVRQKLDHGKAWEGPLLCRRKAGDSVVLDTRIIPVSFSTKRLPDNLVYVRIPPPDVEPATNSVHRDRRSSKTSTGSNSKDASNPNTGSVSEGYMVRRTSSSKMYHTLSVEAPITKVIHILMSARESSPLYIAQALDKVLDIIHTNSSIDLFTPELEKERQKRLEDPVTTDLLGALLSNSTRDALHQRRSSNELNSGVAALAATRSASISVTGSGHVFPTKSDLKAVAGLHQGQQPLPLIPNNVGGGGAGVAGSTTGTGNTDNDSQIREFLSQSELWSLDIFALERLTDHRCLSNLGMAILTRFQLHKTLGCSEAVMQNWLIIIEANYKRNNAYHNSTHAADVLHATAFFLEQDSVKEMCDGVDEATCLLAAVIHDVDHPGKNSAFLCNSGSELANLYNDISVLENHHAAFGFKLTMSDERVNIFQNLDRDSFKLIRQGIIDLVLATDMSKHFVHLNKFVSVFTNSIVSDSEDVSPVSESSSNTLKPINVAKDIPISPENVAILKRMLIKCADVSNPARTLETCKLWAFRVIEEYFSQTDEEKRLGLPVVMPQFDRATCSIPKSQLGFYDYFIHDMFDVWNGFTELPQLSEQIRSNYSYWQQAAASELDRRKSNAGSESS